MFLDSRAKAFVAALSAPRVDVTAALTTALTLLRGTTAQLWRVFVQAPAAGVDEPDGGSLSLCVAVRARGAPSAIASFVHDVGPGACGAYLPREGEAEKWARVVADGLAHSDSWLLSAMASASGEAVGMLPDVQRCNGQVAAMARQWLQQQCDLLSSQLVVSGQLGRCACCILPPPPPPRRVHVPQVLLKGVKSPQHLASIRRAVRHISSLPTPNVPHHPSEPHDDGFVAACVAMLPTGSLDLWATVLQAPFAARASELLVSYFQASSSPLSTSFDACWCVFLTRSCVCFLRAMSCACGHGVQTLACVDRTLFCPWQCPPLCPPLCPLASL